MQSGDLDDSVHMADFKAAPAAVLKQKPFVPKASAAPVTVPHGFALATEQRGSMAEARLQVRARAVVRHMYDTCMIHVGHSDVRFGRILRNVN